jgi:tryptophanyl-tRNA synthetase
MSKLPIIFSGIQPTGNLHLGNYLGSIANWIDLQNNNKCLFGIMDLHSITIPQNPTELKNNILETAIVYLASGIDPKKSIIFAQSAIKEHCELAWILSTLTPLGWLDRMTQFKEKKLQELSRLVADFHSPDPEIQSRMNERSLERRRQEEDRIEEASANLGLYAYPVLMAADILLYKSNIVPVGEDQKQHLELARDIAGAFNRQFKTEFFKLPEPMILGACTRVMSLQDGLKKMSKSDESDLSRINLSDSKDEIVKKIKKAKTDSTIGITYDKTRPEIYNLLNIFSAATGKKPEEIALQYQDSGNGKFKEDLADAIVAMLEPIQKNIQSFKNDLGFVKEVLSQGEQKAREIAAVNIQAIKQIVGLI